MKSCSLICDDLIFSGTQQNLHFSVLSWMHSGSHSQRLNTAAHTHMLCSDYLSWAHGISTIRWRNTSENTHATVGHSASHPCGGYFPFDIIEQRRTCAARPGAASMWETCCRPISKRQEVSGVRGHPEASLELILSSSMCDHCEFFELDSNEDMPGVMGICGRNLLSCLMLMFRFVTSFRFSHISSTNTAQPNMGAAGESMTARGVRVSGTRSGTT